MEVVSQPEMSDPQITVLQGIHRSATVLIELPETLPDLAWLVVEAKDNNVHIRFGEFHRELNFAYPVWINHYQYKDRLMEVDLTINEGESKHVE